jgi:DNA polymerase I-like protein with 3'-5' exonuclease and polymerase domains
MRIKRTPPTFEIEFPLIPVLAKMEIEGIPIDKKYLNDMEVSLEKKLNDLQILIHQSVGQTFNIDSQKQLSEILFQQLHLPNPKKGSTNAEVLKQLMPLAHLLPRFIMRSAALQMKRQRFCLSATKATKKLKEQPVKQSARSRLLMDWMVLAPCNQHLAKSWSGYRRQR